MQLVIKPCTWTGCLRVRQNTQTILLDNAQLSMLTRLATRMDKHLRGTLTESEPAIFHLGGTPPVIATSTRVGNRPHLLIRLFTDGKQAPDGLTLDLNDWQSLKKFLPCGVEMDIMLNAYASGLRSKALRYTKEHCEACDIMVGSQLKHDCITLSAEDSVARYISKYNWIQSPTSTILRAARDAYDRKVTLQTPGQFIDLISAVFKDEVVSRAGKPE